MPTIGNVYNLVEVSETFVIELPNGDFYTAWNNAKTPTEYSNIHDAERKRQELLAVATDIGQSPSGYNVRKVITTVSKVLV